jgi:general secretion pathway protein E
MLARIEPHGDFEQALGDALVAAGKVDRPALERALRLTQGHGHSLVRVLSQLGLVSERDLAAEMARLAGQKPLTPDDMPLEAIEIGHLSPRFLRDRRVLPIGEENGRIILAVADPFDTYVADALRLATGSTPSIRIGEASLIEAAIERLYVNPASAPQSVGDLDVDIEKLKGLAAEAPVVRWVNELIAQAVESRASDIHIEPSETEVRVRFRLDGLLEPRAPAPYAMRAAIVSRIKIMARLDIAERRLPQDGRIKQVVRGRAIDFRVSTLPTMWGESVVLRILDRGTVALNFEALGLSGPGRLALESALERANGVFLVTGPTGSGKTTTLYAALSRIADPSRKIVTVEDPVEYQLDGVNQVQVLPEIGLSFAKVLRATLRQDPDILMVGEIRDGETAQIAAQAALTGHLVLSTLHTNDAATAITRQIDMGVEDYLIASTLIGASAQRLVRRLCPHCREPYRAMPELVERLGLTARARETDIVLWRPIGCARCGGRGYAERTALMETLLMTDRIRRMVMARADSHDIVAAARDEGFRSLFEDGIEKALAGETSLDEVLRVARAP